MTVAVVEYLHETIRMTLNLPWEGGCICGTLRILISDTPLAVLMCHCRNCQQRTGSAFSLSMLTYCKDFCVINVRLGTLDDPSVATPVAQLWARIAHP